MELSVLSFIIYLALAAATGAIIGIFVYRNNENLIDPYADKVDEKWDELEKKIDDLSQKIDNKV